MLFAQEITAEGSFYISISAIITAVATSIGTIINSLDLQRKLVELKDKYNLLLIKHEECEKENNVNRTKLAIYEQKEMYMQEKINSLEDRIKQLENFTED